MTRIKVILSYIGKLLVIIGVAMATCLIWSFIYHEERTVVPMATAALVTIVSGLLLNRLASERAELSYREGFAVVALGWLAASIWGSFPYIFTGVLPHFVDAFFETVSGFTTTGASVVTDIESLPHAVLFWRSLTHWLGGMGIMVLFIALMAGMGFRANILFKAEVPGGPITEKLSPRISETARLLWRTYVMLSVVEVLVLTVLGMPFFDSLCHTFGTMATGGFSTKNASIAHYGNPLIQWTIIIFMFISGANFALHYLTWKRRSLKEYVFDGEFRLYTLIVLLSILLIMINIGSGHGVTEKLARDAAFQVVSIITTTGFVSVDFEQWPAFSQTILIMLMMVGGCSGSTGGAIKVGRLLILFRQAAIELKRLVHPRAVMALKLHNKPVPQETVINVALFFFLYFILICFGTLVLTTTKLDLISSTTAVISCLGNVGPGLGVVGPALNYASIATAGKYTLSLLMLLGRLEILPLLLLLVPAYWSRR